MSTSSFFATFANEMRKMIKISDYVALFDLDGVVMNTEPQYTIFWDEQGLRRLGITNFCSRIKGQTLTQIYDEYFPDDEKVRMEVRHELDEFERNMRFDFIEGADSFIADIRQKGMHTALVTSSDNNKMSNVYNAHPIFKELFDYIITANMFSQSKPHPECFLKGMELFHTDAAHSVVFEDSFHGLEAGKASGAFVIGLATTNPAEALRGKANCIINNFAGKDAAWLEKLL